jgi:hypothetical protein
MLSQFYINFHLLPLKVRDPRLDLDLRLKGKYGFTPMKQIKGFIGQAGQVKLSIFQRSQDRKAKIYCLSCLSC